MPNFKVIVPYVEKELGKESKKHEHELDIEAPDPLEAMQKAMESFLALRNNPYTSWSVVVDHKAIRARESESGEMFLLGTKTKGEARLDEEFPPLFNDMVDYIEAKERLEILEKALGLARSAGSGREAALGILELCQEAIGAEAGGVLLSDPVKKDLYFLAATGPRAKEVMTFRVPAGKGLVGYCFETGQTVVISDAQKDDRFYNKLATQLGYGTRSILAVPLYNRARALGVLELINKVPGDHFTGGDTAVAQYLGDFLAILLMALGKE